MIPLRDNIPHRTQPVVTITLFAINLIVFFYEISLGPQLEAFVHTFGFIPYRLQLPVGIFEKIYPFFTNMFLHAGVWHVLGNCLYLWIFGDNVEDRLGHGKFLIFYFICGIAASVIHGLVNLDSTIPAIGASGAIAGVLGGYFLLFPRARVLTLLPFFIFWQIVEIPAPFFLGVWFLYQFFLGLSSLGIPDSTGVAFWAHVGGFVAGIIFVKVFVRKRSVQY
ncbi:MAG: rhomboid family intramembrane serine protease [Candidatus Omnitrophica bacterium]|nr:rhomboid family intramembrane serine protease [Candidatus Omnitrophota bacterium]